MAVLAWAGVIVVAFVVAVAALVAAVRTVVAEDFDDDETAI
jgi:hypothetical protein